MGNICINNINAEGTPLQVDELVGKLSGYFENSININDVSATEFKAIISLSVSSQWKMPQKELLEITRSLPDTQNLYIRVTAEEPAEEYFEQSIFTHGKWNFENPPSINEQIHRLTTQGIEQISKYLSENGKQLNIKKDRQWIVLYTDIRGLGAFSYFKKIKLEKNGKIIVRLTNGVCLVEDEITTNHVLDILTIINNGDE